MEGFLNIRLRPWLRRLITRLIAIVPAVIVIGISGEEGSGPLLVLSQVILSLQLPFAIFRWSSSTAAANDGAVRHRFLVKAVAWPVCLIIAGLNVPLPDGRRVLQRLSPTCIAISSSPSSTRKQTKRSSPTSLPWPA
jgi:manganese transport protein